MSVNRIPSEAKTAMASIAKADPAMAKKIKGELKSNKAQAAADIAKALGEKGPKAASAFWQKQSPVALKEAGKNYAEALLAADSAEKSPSMSALTEAEALGLIPNLSATLPKGHDYTRDIAAVLKLQTAKNPQKPNPSADQYASFGVMLNALHTPGSGVSNPQLASFMQAGRKHPTKTLSDLTRSPWYQGGNGTDKIIFAQASRPGGAVGDDAERCSRF
jgi:hypothetical protein